MSHEEFAGWIEYYAVEPFGLAVTDAVQAHVASLMANINRDPKRRKESFELKDFLMFSDRQAKGDEPILIEDPEAQSKLLMGLFISKQAR